MLAVAHLICLQGSFSCSASVCHNCTKSCLRLNNSSRDYLDLATAGRILSRAGATFHLPEDDSPSIRSRKVLNGLSVLPSIVGSLNDNGFLARKIRDISHSVKDHPRVPVPRPVVALEAHDFDCATLLGTEQVEPLTPSISTSFADIEKLSQLVQQQSSLCVDIAGRQDDSLGESGWTPGVVVDLVVLAQVRRCDISFLDGREVDHFVTQGELVDAVPNLSRQAEKGRLLAVHLVAEVC